jgi:hypothetical protein
MGLSSTVNFLVAAHGEVRMPESGIYEIGYQPEEIPQWFQNLLNELFDGRGYMAHVRLRNTGQSPKQVTLRFLLSPKGAGYMHPPGGSDGK